MEQAGNQRKYVILQEKDPGFGVQRPPEGFARLDANKEGITLYLQVKNLRDGALPYTVILVYGQNDEVGVIRAGTLEIVSHSSFFSRKLDEDAIQRMHVHPGNILYVIIAAEHPEKTNIPMVGICNKSYPWNESIRQRLRKTNSRSAPAETAASPKTIPDVRVIDTGSSPIMENPSQAPQPYVHKENIMQARSDYQNENPVQSPVETKKDILSNNMAGTGKDAFTQPETAFGAENQSGIDTKGLSDAIRDLFADFRNHDKKDAVPALSPAKAEKKPVIIEEKIVEKPRVDDVRLERKLKDHFEAIEPFFNPRHDYAWYKVNDLARLSNLLFACNMRIPLFANPKILVGLFKYRHLLAGFYRSERNDMKYFVLGVPSSDDSEGRPFENISRWVEIQNPDYGDMTGYWLVYINLQSGEFVR